MSTSKLQKYVSEELGKHISRFSIYENARPYWLYGSELDFYIPEINVAIEVQGQQHYEYNPFFHRTYEKFLDQQRRDKDKRYYCEKRRIKLYTPQSSGLLSCIYKNEEDLSQKPKIAALRISPV